MMKNILYYTCILFLGLLVLNACKKNPVDEMKIEDCGVEKPLEDLAWLALQKEACFTDIDCQTHFYSGVHNFKEVFYQQLKGTNLCKPNFGVELFNCEGQSVKRYAENEKVLFENQVSDNKLLHVCE